MQHISGETAAHTFAWRDMFYQRDELQRVLRALKTRRWLIILVMLLVTTATTLAVLHVTPQYSATAKLLLEPQSSELNNPTAPPVLPGLMIDREAIESEMQILLSRKLAGAVVDRLRLTEDPEFNTELDTTPSILPFDPAEMLRAVRKLLGEKERAPVLDPTAVVRSEVIDVLLKKVSVQREGQSRVIGISVETKSPMKSAEIANKLLDLYFTDRIENQFAQRKRVAHWLDERLTEFKAAADASQRAAEDYRREAKLFSTRDDSGRTERIDAQQLSQISAQLIAARADRAALEARLRSVERLGSSGDYESVPEVISNPVIGSLRTQEARALQRSADLATELGPRHPTLVSSKSELEDIRANIRKEIQRVVASVRSDVGRARAREQVLQDTYAQIETRTAQQNSREIKLTELSREADVNQRILETFLQQFKEVSAKQALAEPEARIVSYAEPPVLASYPKKPLTVAAALVGSFLLGCALALAMERLSATFRTSSEVEEVTGLPVLAVVPQFGRGWPRRRSRLARAALERPSHRVLEAMHTLNVGLMSRGFGGARNRLLFTSSFPGEGKSSIAMTYGRMLAAQGRRVVLVDADFRRPQVAKLLSLEHETGLADVVRGREQVAEVLHKDPASEMRVVPPGRHHGSLRELIDPGALAEFFRQLSLEADCVIVDSPPVLVVPDALIFCRTVDHVVFVVRWNETSREDVTTSVRQLRDAGAVATGTVLNAVDVGKYAAYAYRNTRSYLRGYSRYYGAS